MQVFLQRKYLHALAEFATAENQFFWQRIHIFVL